MKILTVRGDITTENVDAVVNAANGAWPAAAGSTVPSTGPPGPPTCTRPAPPSGDVPRGTPDQQHPARPGRDRAIVEAGRYTAPHPVALVPVASFRVRI